MNSTVRNVTLAGTLVVLLSIASSAQLTYTNSFNTTTGGAAGLITADFNRDGRPDFALLEGSILSVYFNTGSGHFSSPVNTAVPGDSFAIQAADFNRDGKVDVVIAEYNTNRVFVLLGNGNGTFSPPINLTLTNSPVALAVGDVNNDGKVDIVVETCTTSVPGACNVDVFWGNGSGGFSLANALSVPGGAANRNNLVLADFNRDGRLDLATVAMNPSRALVYFGEGNGAFKSPVSLTVNNPLPANSSEAQPNLVAADFNGDAVPDLAVMAGFICGGSACGGGNVTTFLSNGSGGFTRGAQFSVNNQFGAESMRAGDLDNNLRQDLLLFNTDPRTGGILNYLGNGNGTFTAGTSNFTPATPSDVQIRDMNLDGKHDVVTGVWMGNTVWVELNSNGTAFCAPPPSDIIRAKFCAPGSTISTNFVTFLASGNSPLGIQRLELWIDGAKRYQVLNDQLDVTLNLTPGAHTITVVAVDKLSGYSKTTKTVSVG